MSKPTPKKKQQELPAMTGPGVETPNIPDIEEAAEAYVDIRDKRMAMTEKEVQSRTKLSEALQRHKEVLPRDEDGNAFYPYDGRRAILLMGRERVKVRQNDEEEEE